MPRRPSPAVHDDEDFFYAPLFGCGRISESQELLRALKASDHQVYAGSEARFIADLHLRARRGVDTPELGGRWRNHVERINQGLNLLLKANDPARTADFWKSVYADGIMALHHWDFERGGGIEPPKDITPVMRDGEVVGYWSRYGPGEGRPIKRKPAPERFVLGEHEPPLQKYETEMLDLFFKLFPGKRRTHPRGQPMLQDWRLEGPSVDFAPDGTAVLSVGGLIGFYRRFCIICVRISSCAVSERHPQAESERKPRMLFSGRSLGRLGGHERIIG